MASTRPATNYVEQTTTTTTNTPGSMRNYPQQSGNYNRDQDFGESRHHGRWTASGEASDLDNNRHGGRGPFNRTSSSSSDYNRDRDYDRRDNREYDRDNRDYDRRDFSSSRGMNYGTQNPGYDFGALGHPGSSSFGSHPYGGTSYGSHPYGGQSSFPFGSGSYGSHPYGSGLGSHSSLYGSHPYGSSSFGSHPYGGSSFASHPYDSYGSSSYGTHPYSTMSSGYHPGMMGSNYHSGMMGGFGQHSGMMGGLGQHSGMGGYQSGYGSHYGSGSSMMPLYGGSHFGSRGLGRSNNGMITPEIDIYEVGNDYIIELDLPGHSKDHIETKREGNQLVILSKPPARTNQNYHINERSLGQGHVHRKLYLPADADAERINANLSNGVLKLLIPRNATNANSSLSSGMTSGLTSTTPVVLATGNPMSTTTGLPQTHVVRDTTTTTTETKRV